MLAVGGGVLHDHVDIDIGVGKWPEDARGHAGPVLDPDEGHSRLVLGVGDAADDPLASTISSSLQMIVPICPRSPAGPLHGLGRHRSSRARAGASCVPWPARRSVSATLRAERGHLQHLLVGDLGQPSRPRHDARVGGVDAVDVGVDIAKIGLHGDGNGNGAGVGPAAAERGDAACARARCPESR